MNKFKPFLKLIGSILAVVSVFFLIKILKESYAQIHHKEFSLQTILVYLFLIFWSLLTYLAFAYAWKQLLKNKYPDFKFLDSFRIISLSQIAKYLPGNVAHFASRYYLADKHLTKTDTTITLVLETIMFTLASFIIGCGYFFYHDLFNIFDKNKVLMLFVLASVIVIILVVVFIIIKKNHTSLKLPASKLITTFFIYLLLPFMGGLSIYLLFQLILQEQSVSYLLCVFSFSISFLLGFVVPGAPGGIGIREYSFTLLMAPFISTVLALEVILIFRVLSLVGDILLFVIGKFIPVKISHD